VAITRPSWSYHPSMAAMECSKLLFWERRLRSRCMALLPIIPTRRDHHVPVLICFAGWFVLNYKLTLAKEVFGWKN
jgi:hypothetical protein